MAFERGLVEEIDGLWQAATFLRCGDAEEAESLLVSAMASAARRHAAGPPAPQSVTLEPYLVRVFLDGVPTGPGEAGVRPGVSSTRTAASPGREVPPNGSALDSDREIPVTALHAAAASVPAWARAAIWLVLIRRWSYDDTANLLGIDHDDLRELLGFQDAFAAIALGEPAEASVRRRMVD